MKGLFKFTTAALALLTMASCSNDDLFGNGESAQTPEEGALVVEMEDLIDHVSTRAAFVPESDKKNTIYWQNTDFIEVLDEAMVKYDIYGFDANKGSFVNDAKAARVGEPKYALFGGGKYTGKGAASATAWIDEFGWQYAKDETFVNYKIPTVLNYAQDGDIAGNGVVAYQSYLPMWGDASVEGDGVKVNMHYLTAVLRVYLKNASSNITQFKVEAFEDQACTKELAINGTAKAIIANADGANKDAQLTITTPSTTNKNSITVTGINTATGDAYLYIPLIAQKYGALKFYYTTSATPAPADWKLIKTTKPTTLKRQTVYRLSLESFEVAGDNLEGINAILAGQAEATADVNITTQKATVVGATGKTNVLKIPAGMKANINLNLKGLTLTDNLEIESEDGEYAGTLVINTAAAATGTKNVYINLPNADVVFIGDYSVAEFGKYIADNVDNDKLIVKSLTFSNGDNTTKVTKVKNVYVDKESTEAIVIGEDATVTGGIALQPGNESNDNVAEIEINGTVTGGVFANKTGVATTITVGEKGSIGGVAQAVGDINVEGTVTGDITSAEGDVTVGDEATASGNISAVKGTVTITSKNAIAGTITTGELELGGKANVTAVGSKIKKLTLKENAKVGTVTIADEGSAVIDVDAQDGKCEAITTSITLGKKSTLTLKQGFIKEILNGTYAVAEVPTLKFDDANNYSAIGSLKTFSIKIDGASKGNGKAPAVAGYFTKDVWTASQLAAVGDATGAIRLMNDIDLTNVTAWSMPALTKDFAGIDMKQYTGLGLTASKYPTISNVTILNKDSKNADIDNAGLFSTVKADTELKDFNVKNAQVTLTGAKKNAGILVGSVNGGVYVSNVAVTESAIKTTANFDNVGGLIGDAVAAYVGYTKTPIGNATTTVKVALTDLQGRYNLGGLVGNAGAGNSIANKVDVAITNGFSVVGAKTTVDVDGTGDPNAGTVGMIAGKVAGKLSITSATVADKITGNRTALGFKADFKAVVDAGKTKIYCYYGGPVTVGKIASTLTVNGVTAATGSDLADLPATAALIAAEKAKTGNFVLHAKYADWDK